MRSPLKRFGSDEAAIKWRLLVVDDQEQMRSAFQRVFALEGFSVTAAGTGSRALELVSSQSFDLVLLDVNMPDMDGFTVLEKLRKLPGLEGMPVIMVTGMVDSASVLRGKTLGVDDYLIKPYRIGELLARVGKCLNR